MGLSDDYRACAICARTMLRGESVYDYVNAEGETLPVCALCKPRAEALGWLPAALASSMADGGARRRPRIDLLRERLAEINLRERFARPPRPELEPQAQHGPAREPETREPRPVEPLDAFNASPEARKVAGLARSLGDPLVSVRAGAGGELITVAWELTWYQWEVGGGEVREVARGEEIGELAEGDREWNASLADGGRLRLGE
ncbi:MAG: hypothetical protein GEU88_15725 [Solirubrobacterales bacterium]|nr:hypothetical protein [Solirubrobacterales bacterium]